MARARKYRSQTNTTDFIRKTDLNCISAPTPLFCSSWIKACFPAWINPAKRSGSNVASVSKVLNTKPWKEQRKHSTINCYLKSPHYFLCLEFFFGWPLVSTTMATATKTAKLSLDQQNNMFARTTPFCAFLCSHGTTMTWKCLKKSRFIMQDVTTRKKFHFFFRYCPPEFKPPGKLANIWEIQQMEQEGTSQRLLPGLV